MYEHLSDILDDEEKEFMGVYCTHLLLCPMEYNPHSRRLNIFDSDFITCSDKIVIASIRVLKYNISEALYFLLNRRQQMKQYKFYGWETADIKDTNGKTPRDYYDLLLTVWCAGTCAPRMRDEWSLDNPTLGQCSITAFLMQDFFGGKVYGILRPGGNYHCFNVVDGCVFDLTSEQFGDEALDYSNCPEQFRETHFAKEEKRLRYEYLRSKVIDLIQKS